MMMNFKISGFLVIIFTFLLVNSSNGQQIYIGSGIENAIFKDYVNSLGVNTLNLNYAKTEDVFFEGGLRSNLYTNRLQFNLGVSYNNYEIQTGFFDGFNDVPLNYNLEYFSLKIGLIITILNLRRFKLNMHSHLSHDWLSKGTSSFNNTINNLYTSNTFDKTLISFHKGISAEYQFSENLTSYVSINISDSFREENEDSVNGEKYTFHTNALSIGILIDNLIFTRKTICYGGF